MESTQIHALYEPPLAAMPQLSEKPRQGFETKKTAWNPGPSVYNSTAAIGLRAGLALECVRETRQTGLYYMPARYYSAALGRFLQADPSGFGGGFNLYAYAGNDPVNQTDSTGLSPDGGGFTVTLSESVATPFMAASGGPSSMIVSATATYDEVTVSLWPNAAFGRGHVGIGVDTDDTHGYYPRILGFLSWGADVPGVVRDDAAYNAGQTPQLLHHRSNASSDALMQAAISARFANPGYYNLTGNNCTQFVASVLRAGHIDPQSSTQAPMVDPKQYFDGLKQSGEWF